MSSIYRDRTRTGELRWEKFLYELKAGQRNDVSRSPSWDFTDSNHRSEEMRIMRRDYWRAVSKRIWASFTNDPIAYAPSFGEIPRWERRTFILSLFLSTIFFWCLYILIPDSGDAGRYLPGAAFVILWLFAGTAIAILVRVRSTVILVACALFGLSFYLCAFSYIYWALSHIYADCIYMNGMLSKLSKIDSLYFTLTTMTTTGYGDISPRNGACRAATSAQMLSGFFFFVIFGALLITHFASLISSSKK